MRITIGVHVRDEPERLAETLRAIASCTARDHDVVLLQDRRGAPFAFNELARHDVAPVIAFLENGALVTDGWLERLLRALDADPRHGLAGPSTNRAWNEQCAFPSARDGEIASVARLAAERFGEEVRTLRPLYSLSDFCLAVRRSVIDDIGGAEEAYGRGPCWEMDLNIRAARAGWEGVWVCGAYVHRLPISSRRLEDEARLFPFSKRLYQERFCGARLRGEKRAYREHCRGDDCPNFAPAELIAIRRTAERSHDKVEPTDTLPSVVSSPDDRLSAAGSSPVVSCIMPTRDRRAFVPVAIQLFLAQDYSPRELVIVDDGEQPVRDLVPGDPRIRYVRREPAMTIGAKRNLACEEARGELIAHWDDDDWYPSWRLTLQVSELLAAGADLCGSSALYFHDVVHGRAWEYRYPPESGWIAGTTLLYRKSFWMRNRFPATSNGEDSAFVCARVPKVIRDLSDPTLCVASLHQSNTATRPDGPLWQRYPIDAVLRLESRSKAAPPLVSCVMPTYNRRAFVPLALDCFHRQTYGNRELIVVDDGDDGVGDLVSEHLGARYLHAGRRVSIGTKRNLGCSEARGSVIVLWDDDDWYGPGRLELQAGPIFRGEADMTGLANRFVLQLPQKQWWAVSPELHRSMFAADVTSGTIAFRRSIWTDGNRFPDMNLREDAAFVELATRAGHRLLRIDDDGVFVYVRHGANTWRFDPGTFLIPRGWRETVAPPLFSTDVLDAYAAAATRTAGRSS